MPGPLGDFRKIPTTEKRVSLRGNYGRSLRPIRWCTKWVEGFEDQSKSENLKGFLLQKMFENLIGELGMEEEWTGGHFGWKKLSVVMALVAAKILF